MNATEFDNIAFSEAGSAASSELLSGFNDTPKRVREGLDCELSYVSLTISTEDSEKSHVRLRVWRTALKLSLVQY